MPLDIKTLKYFDDKFDNVYTKIDRVKKEAIDSLNDHIKSDHKGVIGKMIIVVSAFIVGVSCLLGLLVIYLNGAL